MIFMKALIKSSTVRLWFKRVGFKLMRPCLVEKMRRKRELDAKNNASNSIQVRDLIAAVEKSWCRETCYPPAQQVWTQKVPALGQCAPTALIIQDYLKGEILYCRHVRHYWNRLPEGVEMDLTGRRFAEDSMICEDAVVHRSQFTNNRDADTLARYTYLKHLVESNLGFKLK